jgi:branched-chain amino acid transport system substrate-binding protein
MEKQERELKNDVTDEGRGSLSRRDFLRLAGVAGATVGLGAGLGGALAACGGGTSTTTAASAASTTASGANTTTTAAPVTTSAPAVVTTASSGAEAGREVKVGVVIPVTGVLALFGVGDKWGLGLIAKHMGDSMVMGDGKNHKLTWLLRDTQSDSNRAGQVTSDLIMNDKVDLTVAAGAPDTVNPAADQAETLGSPLISCNTVWEAFVFGRGAKIDTEFKWVFGHLLGGDQVTSLYVMAANKIQTNKVVGFLVPNNADGQAFLTKGEGWIDRFTTAGYTTVLPSQFNPGTEDFTDLISGFKKAGCEIQLGSNPGIDFPNFWKQAIQQGYKPKMCAENVGLSTYEDMVALGDIVVGLLVGFSWHKDWPFKDPITGMTCAELAADYETSLGTMWSNMITPYARMGWAVDVFKRTENVDSKDSIVKAIKGTNVELINGRCDFTAKVDPAGNHITPNITKQCLAVGQVVKGAGKWKYDWPQVAVIDAPADYKVDRVPDLIKYS